MRPGSGGGPRIRVVLGPAEGIRLRVVLDPVQTALAAMQGVLHRTSVLRVDPVRTTTVTLLGQHVHRDAELVPALVSTIVPAAAGSLLPVRDHALDDHRDFLGSEAAVAQLLTDLEEITASGVAGTWAGPTSDPARWMRSNGDLLLGLTQALLPHWAGVQDRLTREVGRVGTAVVRGTLDGLLASLHPRISWDGRTLSWPGRDDAVLDTTGEPTLVVLSPRVDGTGLIGVTDGMPGVLVVSYPLETALAAPGSPERRDELSELLTPQRARLLRALARPRTMGELAVLLQLAPSSVTHHCARLELAGIVVRERRGQHVRVTRTEHGEALVDRSS